MTPRATPASSGRVKATDPSEELSRIAAELDVGAETGE